MLLWCLSWWNKGWLWAVAESIHWLACYLWTSLHGWPSSWYRLSPLAPNLATSCCKCRLIPSKRLAHATWMKTRISGVESFRVVLLLMAPDCWVRKHFKPISGVGEFFLLVCFAFWASVEMSTNAQINYSTALCTDHCYILSGDENNQSLNCDPLNVLSSVYLVCTKINYYPLLWWMTDSVETLLIWRLSKQRKKIAT